MASTRISKLEVARWAIETLPALTQASGVFHAANASAPAHWVLDKVGFKMIFTTQVLLLPTDAELSSMLDVWLAGGHKLLCVSWFPSQPWVPPHISAFRNGDWMHHLGWTGGT